MEFNLQKFSPKISTKLPEQVCTQNIKKQTHGIIYPENATYALKRRLIVPTWWVESILFTLGKKETWFPDFLADHYDLRIYEHFKVTSTNIFFMFFLWNELCRKMFAAENNKISKIKIDLTKFLHGTPKQTKAILKTLEEDLSKPIKIIDVTKSEETHEVHLSKNGYLNIFRKVSLTEDVNGIWLTLHFSQSLSNIFATPDIKSKNDSYQNCFVTINPNLFYAMQSRVNIKKALNGLFLEYNKQNETLDPTHTSFNIETDGLESFHKIVSSTAETLYHDGIVGVPIGPPVMKISEIKNRQKVAENEEQSPLVFAWNLSLQTAAARNFEENLSQQLDAIRRNAARPKLFSEPPRDELQKVRTAHPELQKYSPPVTPPNFKIESPPQVTCDSDLTKMPALATPKIPEAVAAAPTPPFVSSISPVAAPTPPFVSSISPVAAPTPSVVAPIPSVVAPIPSVVSSTSSVVAPTLPVAPEPEPPVPAYVPPKKPNFHTFSERELSIFVIRFYETLNQKQKKMFEHERRKMTNEQFRSFMIPILQRTHASLVP